MKATRRDWTRVVPYLFIAPAMVYLMIVTIAPAVLALPVSLTDWTALDPRRHYIGLRNYGALLSDRTFFHSLGVMAQFFVCVPLIMALGLGIAMLLDRGLRGTTAFRVVFYSPVITSTIAAAVLFDWFYQPTYGLFNAILAFFGLPACGWTADIRSAVPSVIIFRVWKETGAAMLIYLAGLQDVPESLMEAAEIDGAGSLQKFRRITLPCLKPANVYVLIVQAIGVFMIFQETYMLKGPLESTDSIINYIYNKGFQSAEMGYASAMSFVLFIVVLAATLLQYKAMKGDEGVLA